ncbi:DUF1624 domain-containing protein [candidate division WOR-3 bacterium]|nr:DUF1624 domain-containing protein [candidate division WOR-3 bacterium]
MHSVLPEKPRFLFLDIARGLAIVEMIHGHSLHALLSPSLRAGGFFAAWNYVREYTAPFFLLIAGFTFVVSTLPRSEEYRHFSTSLIRRIARFFFVIIVGYVLHLPFFSLQKTLQVAGTPAWDRFLQVDILQCIGVSLCLLQFLYFLRLKTVVRTMILILFIATVLVMTLCLPFVPLIEALPTFVKYYFVQSHFSPFPFSAYLFFGALCGRLFMRRKHEWTGSAVILSLALVVLSGIRYIHPDTILCSNFLLKSGVLLFITTLLSCGERLWHRLPSVIKVFGQESLFLYVLHLFIIYGSVFNNGLRHLFGGTLSCGEVYTVVCILTILLSLLAYSWHSVKHTYPVVARGFRYALYITFTIRFLTRPY